ncbi:hypothetical protein NE848_12180 [Gramella jeungdoensis]|uniref:Uncharacterized protein n=1 Tax=Gramella jeungdoensis TaxID=708091 RepID=A0ABT0Z337_9FLAO|nr:hypothetical protein [Gramella jeungdoensis]MCM8570141.1 hypothetical protein [Gramella jeungdoensis]
MPRKNNLVSGTFPEYDQDRLKMVLSLIITGLKEDFSFSDFFLKYIIPIRIYVI